jgi:lysophospholipid acyltransferase
MLLTAETSFITWGRLGFYGHILIAGSMAFFYSGGTKFFRRMQAKQALKVTEPPVSTPVQEKQFMLPPSIDQIIPPQK